MSALGAVVVARESSGWTVTCTRPGRADTRRAFADRVQAVIFGTQQAALLDLPFVQVRAEPEEAGA